MDRVIVIGWKGSGKSTFARKLASVLELELYHLDNLFWKPGWIDVPIEEQKEITKELVKKERRIIDGNYAATLPIRLERADTVIFLDVPRWLCIYSIFKRRVQYWNKQRPDINAGKERISFEFLRYVWRFKKDKRPEVVKLVESVKGEKDIYTTYSRNQLDQVMEILRNK